MPPASDPVGFGWNLLGTADYGINIGIINVRLAWFIAIAAILIGHITAVYLAHVIALRTLKDIDIGTAQPEHYVGVNGGLYGNQPMDSGAAYFSLGRHTAIRRSPQYS